MLSAELHYPDAANLLDDKASIYVSLQNLQGEVILTLYGFYRVWGILKLLALEPVGDAISEGVEISRSLCKKMKAALQCIHNAGFFHGNIAHHNFCRMAWDKVFLVYLERCQYSGNPSELINEMNQVDAL